MDIIKIIRENEKEVLIRKIPDSVIVCKKCFKIPEAFKVHECKPRILLVIISKVVKKVITYLLRLKCTACNKTFIAYPDFVIPYKRYIKDHILHFSQTYIETDKTYPKVVQKDKSGIVHETSEDSRYIELAESTVHRWITYLSRILLCLRDTRKLIKDKDPCSMIHRSNTFVSPRMYRSPNRKNQLENCFKVIQIENEFTKVFQKSVFPHFAIRPP